MTHHEARVACAANGILWLWKEDTSAVSKNPWYKAEARQAYRDAMNIMQSCGLIEDYNMMKVQVKINGEWSAARLTLG